MTDTMSVIMPDGTRLDGVPVGTPKAEILAKYHAAYPSTLADVGKSAWGGLMTGLNSLANTPGNLVNLGVHGAAHVADYISPGTGAAMNRVMDAVQSIPGLPFLSTSASNAPVMQATGGSYVPKTTAGQYAHTVGEFAPAAVGGEAGIIPRLGRVVAPALASETAGQVTAGTPYEGAARVVGGLVGGIPALAGAGARAFGALGAETLNPADAGLVQDYEALGGNLRPGQFNPSRLMRYGDAVVADTPFPRTAGFKPEDANRVMPATQQNQFNRLLSNTFGENADRNTSDVIAEAHRRIGNVYNTVIPRNNVKLDDPLKAALDEADARLSEAAPAMRSDVVSQGASLINRIRDRLATADGFSGKQYKIMRERDGTLDELINSGSPTLKRVGIDLKRALDDAFMRQAPPEDAAALREANAQYRALSTIEPLAAKAPSGNIPPGSVLNAVVAEYGDPAKAGNLGTVARAGKAFLQEMPNSGTEPRQFWRHIIKGEMINAGRAATALPVSAVLGRGVNTFINSPQMRARLLGNALRNAGPNAQVPSNAAQLGALLSEGP